MSAPVTDREAGHQYEMGRVGARGRARVDDGPRLRSDRGRTARGHQHDAVGSDHRRREPGGALGVVDDPYHSALSTCQRRHQPAGAPTSPRDHRERRVSGRETGSTLGHTGDRSRGGARCEISVGSEVMPGLTLTRATPPRKLLMTHAGRRRPHCGCYRGGRRWTATRAPLGEPSVIPAESHEIPFSKPGAALLPA